MTEEQGIKLSPPIRVRALDIARFASVIGAEGDYYDLDGAEEDVVAPPGFHFTLSRNLERPTASAERLADGRQIIPGAPVAERALATGTEVELIAPIRGGQSIVVSERLLSKVRKNTSQGEGHFITFERLYADESGQTLVRELHSQFLHGEEE